jgi:DNA modification methylase
MWRECYRVLKPGGRLLAFASPRTFHRMWCNIEDAGFVIEDTIAWTFGSGWPKHRSKLKPAFEPICVARKGPVSLLDIEGCRVGGQVYTDDEWAAKGRSRPNRNTYGTHRPSQNPAPPGRWPANLILDEEAVDYLGGNYPRFFYVAKASESERNAGLDEGETNGHPTVKPVSLMRTLVRLACPAGGVVFDPYAGSGTTGVACVFEGFGFIGFDDQERNVKIARRRISWAIGQVNPWCREGA